MEKISVIVPIYRVEKYLRRCLESLINQTYSNLEIILVDDGSDDASPEICDEYALKDHRISVVHQNNAGVADARNAGLSKATGAYITFVDPDDYINPYTYEDMMQKLYENQADMVMCGYKYVYEDPLDKAIEDRFKDDAKKMILSGKQALKMSYESFDRGVLFSVLWNKICKKSLYNGISFPSGRIYEDEARLCQVLYRSEKIVYLDHPYYFYHQHKKSIVGKEWSKKNAQLLDAYIDKLEFYGSEKEDELWNIELRHLMHMFCYTQSKFNQNGIECNLFNDIQGNRFRRLMSIPDRPKSSNALGLECFLFLNFYNLYSTIWSVFKR